MERDTPLIGHARQREQLVQDLAKGNLAHAYLFCGQRHLGKYTIAKWFAALLLTQGQDEEERRRSLHLMRRNFHPDLLTLDQLWMEGVCTDWSVIARSSNIPQDKRAKNRLKTNTISIEEVRELQRRLQETSQTGKTCCLIRSLERMNAEAANALLKTLEEPPPHVIFCCTSEAPAALPPTILSRMRMVQFYPVPAAELRGLLTPFTEEDRLLVGSVARGAPGIILRCRENPDLLRVLRQGHLDALRFLETGSCRVRLEQLLSILEHEEDRRRFTEHLFLHLRERLRADDASARSALSFLRHVLPVLSAWESNTQKPLLAAELALRVSIPSAFPSPPT